MGRAVEAAAREVVAERLGDGQRKRLLLRLVVFTVHDAVVDHLPPFGDRPDERHGPLPQPHEQVGHLGRGHQRFVQIQQRVVGMIRVAQIIGGAAGVVHHLLQVRAERRKVVGRAGLPPHLHAEAGGAAPLRDKLGRQLRRLIEVAPRHPDQRRLVGIRLRRSSTASAASSSSRVRGAVNIS